MAGLEDGYSLYFRTPFHPDVSAPAKLVTKMKNGRKKMYKNDVFF